MTEDLPLVMWFSDLGCSDGDKVGGKNASLGEMIGKLREAGIRVPGGFATTATAYRRFIEAIELNERLSATLEDLEGDGSNLAAIGKAVRGMILQAEFPAALSDTIIGAYREMTERGGHEATSVAVRSSATAEDHPEASFAGSPMTGLRNRRRLILFW